MAKYIKTCSIAYTAASIQDMHIAKEPWLHARCVMLQKYDEPKDGERWGKLLNTAVYWVVYIWDTREVVQWVEDKRHWSERPSTSVTMKQRVKAVDNAQPLKDPNKLVPGWAWEKLGKRSELYSFENEPKEVRDAYYSQHNR